MKQTGIGFMGLLTLLFIGLKLGGVIDWNWFLVLLPLYGPLVIVLAFVIVLLGIVCFGVLVGEAAAKKRAQRYKRG